MVLIMLMAFLLPEDGQTLVLRGGKKIPIKNGFEVKGQVVTFMSKAGESLQLPLKVVDLESTREIELLRKESAGNPMVARGKEDKDLSALVDDVMATGPMQGGEILKSTEEGPSLETNEVLDGLNYSEMLTQDRIDNIETDIVMRKILERAKMRRQRAQAARQDSYASRSNQSSRSNAGKNRFSSTRTKREIENEMRYHRRQKMFNSGIDIKDRDYHEGEMQYLEEERASKKK